MRSTGVDLDGCLVNWVEGFQRKLITVTGRDLFPPYYIPRVWDWAEAAGYTDAEIRTTWNVIKGERNWWAGLDCYHDEHVVQTLDELDKRQAHGESVYFITSRPGYKAKAQSEDWLRHHGMPHPTVLISHEKGLAAAALALDAYIDDNLENVMGVRVHRPQCSTYLCDRPWNRGNDITGENIRESCPVKIPGVKRCATAYDMLVSLTSPPDRAGSARHSVS